MPPRPLLLLLVPLACALAAGCVEFESQTILVRLDKATDTIHARLIYHGLYAGDEGSPEKSVAEALKQLKAVVDRGTRFYIFDNWPLEADIGPPEEGEPDKPGNALLRPFTKVRNGKFFVDRAGRLCAWQDLEISNASAFLDQVNRFISLGVLAGKVEPLKEGDETTRRLLQQWMAKGEKWLVVDAKGVALRLPLSDRDAARLKRELLNEAVDTVERDARRKDEANAKGETPAPFERTLTGSQVRILEENRLSFIHEPDGVAIRLSPDSRGMLRFDWFNRGVYVPNLLEPLKQGEVPPDLPAPLERQMDGGALVEGFAAPPEEGG